VNGLRIIACVGFLGCTCALHAQERPENRPIEHRIAPSALQSPVGAPVGYSTRQLRERLDPVRRERMQIRRWLDDRRTGSVLHRRSSGTKRDLNRESGFWKATVGNSAAKNWSPYPDRYLDARTIKFPLPRK